MPKLTAPLGALYMNPSGSNLLLGNSVFQIDDAARTDTLAGDGEYQFYISGSTIVLQVFDKEAAAWRIIQLAATGAAPDNATYLVTTANATLTAEEVVGATPGGELGGTWAAPTVDATHAGSSHLALATNALLLGAAAAAGAAGTTLRSNDTIAAFEATAPTTQAFGDAAVVGTAAFATRRDHKHAMPADPVTAHTVGTTSITGAVAIANTETVVASASIASGLVAGSTFSVKVYGRLTSGAVGGSSIFRFRVGPTTLTGNIPATLTIVNANLATDAPFKLEMLVTVRSSGGAGTVIGNVSVSGGVVGAFTAVADVSALSATVAVDTTVTNLVEVTYISGNAGTTATFENAALERVKV